MAAPQELVAPELYRCYHCGVESPESLFKYFDNKKKDQPRYQCQHCQKCFTLGSHGRPQGKTYAKKRNEDPAELKSLSRQCRHCGVADHALFKYYNNNNLSQPRFKCLSCKKQFQMRLLGFGEERRLVHTSSQKRGAPRRKKQGVPEPFPIASSSSEDGSYQPCDGSFMPMAYDPLMPLESDARLLPAMSIDEDVQFSDFLESELAGQENHEADPISEFTGNGDDVNFLPPPLSDEAAQYVDFLEAELLSSDETTEAPNADAFSSSSTSANVDGGLAAAWSTEAAEWMDFIPSGVGDNEAPDAAMIWDNLAEVVSESTDSNTTAEVMYGTWAGVNDNDALDAAMVWDNLAESTSNTAAEVMYGTRVVESAPDSNSWSPNDTSLDASNLSYADAAAVCCHEMDLEMARENSMPTVAPVQPIASESSVGSTMVFADPNFQWNEDEGADEDDMEMAY